MMQRWQTVPRAIQDLESDLDPDQKLINSSLAHTQTTLQIAKFHPNPIKIF